MRMTYVLRCAHVVCACQVEMSFLSSFDSECRFQLILLRLNVANIVKCASVQMRFKANLIRGKKNLFFLRVTGLFERTQVMKAEKPPRTKRWRDLHSSPTCFYSPTFQGEKKYVTLEN